MDRTTSGKIKKGDQIKPPPDPLRRYRTWYLANPNLNTYATYHTYRDC